MHSVQPGQMSLMIGFEMLSLTLALAQAVQVHCSLDHIRLDFREHSLTRQRK